MDRRTTKNVVLAGEAEQWTLALQIFSCTGKRIVDRLVVVMLVSKHYGRTSSALGSSLRLLGCYNLMREVLLAKLPARRG